MDTIYTATPGTTCYLDGERGTVTAVRASYGINSRIEGAFVKMALSGNMRYATLGSAVGERDDKHEVVSHHSIDREDFDRLNGIDKLRTELGWET